MCKVAGFISSRLEYSYDEVHCEKNVRGLKVCYIPKYVKSLRDRLKLILRLSIILNIGWIGISVNCCHGIAN
jgi:hypothetical protein|tara:strand:+ start:3436 stop:3651 length:216 start_codon:yes stop_codon:yes gene_type:complete